MKTHNKAMELSINTIVILAVCLITLFAVTVYFFGGFKTTGGAATEIGKGAAGETGGIGGRVGGITESMWGAKEAVYYCCGNPSYWSTSDCYKKHAYRCDPNVPSNDVEACRNRCEDKGFERSKSNWETWNTDTGSGNEIAKRCHCYK